jgi:hypothetical protein
VTLLELPAQDDCRGVGAQLPPGWLLHMIAPLSIQTKERGIVTIGSVINHAQLDFVQTVEDQINETGQVRICVLKARQIGISTIIEAIIFTLSVWLDGYSSLIIAHENEASEGLLEMTKLYWDKYPFAEFHDEKYKGKKNLAWADSNSRVTVKTAENEKAGRSKTIHGLHASEVAFWPDPEVLMSGLRQSIPSFGITMVFLESTANGVGNYFHKTCMEAMRGDNEFAFKFYPWHEHPEYTARYVPANLRHKITLHDLDEEELQLRAMGITDDRLLWRRYAITNLCQGSVETFHQEYPTNPHEAFVSTGRNVLPIRELLRHYDPRAGQRGVLVRNKASRTVEFQPRSDGWFTVYSHPSPDKSWGIYLCGGDPTHTTTGDNAVVQVINRRTLEQVGVYRNKIDPINFGKHMQLIGYYFNEALLAPEKEGPGYATVGCIVADEYPNVFQGTNVTSAKGHPVDVMGWSTNSNTKHLAIQTLVKHVTDPMVELGNVKYGLIVHDELTMLELRDYVTTENGGYENSDGSEYDDGVMALAIALAVHDMETPPPAYEPRPEHELPAKVQAAPVQAYSSGKASFRPELDAPAPDDEEEPPAPAWEAWSIPHGGES